MRGIKKSKKCALCKKKKALSGSKLCASCEDSRKRSIIKHNKKYGRDKSARILYN